MTRWMGRSLSNAHQQSQLEIRAGPSERKQEEHEEEEKEAEEAEEAEEVEERFSLHQAAD